MDKEKMTVQEGIGYQKNTPQSKNLPFQKRKTLKRLEESSKVSDKPLKGRQRQRIRREKQDRHQRMKRAEFLRRQIVKSTSWMRPRRPKETRANKTRSTVIKRGKKGGPLFFPFFWVRKELQKTRQSIEHETTFVVQKLSASLDKKQRKIISEIIGILLLDLRLFSFLRLAAGNPFQS